MVAQHHRDFFSMSLQKLGLVTDPTVIQLLQKRQYTFDFVKTNLNLLLEA